MELPGPSTLPKETHLMLKDFAIKQVAKLPSGRKMANQLARSLVEFVAKDMRPLAIVESEGFKSFVAALDPTYQIPSRGHITTVLQKIYAELKVKITGVLSSVTFVALTTDHCDGLIPVCHSPLCEEVMGTCDLILSI